MSSLSQAFHMFNQILTPPHINLSVIVSLLFRLHRYDGDCRLWKSFDLSFLRDQATGLQRNNVLDLISTVSFAFNTNQQIKTVLERLPTYTVAGSS